VALLLKIVVAILALVIGAGFWSCARSPRHMRVLLSDARQLQRIIDFLGRQALAQEAAAIQPVFGSYDKNIALFERAHLTSLSRTRNFLAVFAVALLAGAYALLGPAFAALLLGVLVLPLLGGLPASAKDNNVTHLHTVMLNLLAWNAADAGECARYCAATRPDFGTLRQQLLQPTAE
jgi:hypothetical protein